MKKAAKTKIKMKSGKVSKAEKASAKSDKKKENVTGAKKVAAKKVAAKKKVVEDKKAEGKGKKSGKGKSEVVDAPAVHTESRTDKSKMPSILQSKAYLELVGLMDKEEKKLNIPKTNLYVGGHIQNAISTGVLTLDFTMGGGYAGGRFHVSPGKEGSGKCCNRNTNILTEKGLVKISSLFKKDDPWGEPIKRPIKVMTSVGVRTATELHRRKASGLVRVRAEYTLPLECTKEHPVLVVDKITGELVYKKAAELKPDDIMFVKRGTEASFGKDDQKLGVFNNRTIKSGPDLARIVGVMLADGNVTREIIRVSKRQNLTILDTLFGDIERVFGAGYPQHKNYHLVGTDGKPYIYRRLSVGTELSGFMCDFVLDEGNAPDKRVPKWIFKSSVETIKVFLKAFFTCDYSAEGIASKQLAEDLAALLLLIGIPTNIRTKPVKTKAGTYDYYTLTFGLFAPDFTSLSHYEGMVGKNRKKLKKNRSIKEPTHKVGSRAMETATDPYKWKSFPWAYDIVTKFKEPMKGHNSGMYLVEGKYQRLRLNFDKNITLAQLEAKPDFMTSLELLLPKLANSIKFIRDNDLICVRVLGVDKIKGTQDVYDLTVPSVHNFIANGFVVHNSTAVVTSIANATAQNVPSLVIDAEASMDAGYADRALKRFNYSMKKMLGIFDPDKGLWVEPPMVRIQQVNNGEQVFRMIRRTLKAMPDIRRDHKNNYWAVTTLLNKDGGVKSETAVEHDGTPQMMFYIDSLAALVPDILDSDDEKATIGAAALMFTRMLPAVCNLITRKNCILVGTNQLRDQIGGFSRPGMPTPQTQPGGNALKFYTELRTFINSCSASAASWNVTDSGEYLEEPSVFGGVDRYVFTKFKNNKNKAFVPKRENFARIRFMHNSGSGDGYDASFDVFQFLKSTGQATKRGNTLSLDIQPATKNGRAFELPLPAQAKKVGWMDFKRAVELPENKQKMFQHCRSQLKSGYAFDLEKDRVTNGKEAVLSDDDGL